ncbi:hypothetical protein [Alteromonas sp. W364]|uniref:hypothetical protein n=1 Tax=Alteromonas sp. W364 TaxID=3075610 RepID=UPI002883E10E|nr:hypothetical protein [Alteromonas sp. W364]MDT0629866.1 hypothetical protein [Alteromonas sp. W364]
MFKYLDLFDSEVIKCLGDYLDFELLNIDKNTDWITLSPNYSTEIIAGEGSGGVYVAYGEREIEKRSILFISSEGQAGKLGNDLTEFVSMIIEIPYWFDLLKFSGGGQLSEMRKTAQFMLAEYNEEYPDYNKAKSILKDKLDLAHISDPIALLHSCIQNSDCEVLANDGWKY